MSMPSNQPATSSAIITILQNIVTAVNGLSSSFTAKKQVTSGNFSLAAAPTTSVAQAFVTATSTIQITPVNASAATLMGSSKSLYIASRVVGVSFTVGTADGTNATGAELFSYSLVNQ